MIGRSLRAAWTIGHLAVERGLVRQATAGSSLALARHLLAGRRDLYIAIDGHARSRPDLPAISDAGGTWSYAELQHTVEQVAGALHSAGVQPTDRVGLLLPNGRRHLAVMAGCRRLGAVPVPLSPHSPPDEAIRRLSDLKARAAVVPPDLVAAGVEAVSGGRYRVVVAGDSNTSPTRAVSWDRWLERSTAAPQPPSPRSGSADVVLHTSGTTGRSKATGIPIGKAGLDTALRLMQGFDLTPDSVLFTPCPPYHAAPMLLTGLCLSVGGHVVVDERFDADSLNRMLRHGSTHAFLVPTLMQRLLDLPEGTSKRLRRSPMRALINGGAALRSRVKRDLLHAYGPILFDFYGATEMGVVSIAQPGDLATHPDSVGRVLPGVRCQLVDEGGAVVPPGQPGELFVQTDTMSVDEASLVPGWVSAGDIARIEGDRLYIVDRKRDVVITGGVNVFPVDVELALERHPCVEEAACFGVADDTWGEAVHAAVVLSDGDIVTPDELREHCKLHLQPAAVPKAIRVVDSLPRSPTGKVLRRTLRDSTSTA